MEKKKEKKTANYIEFGGTSTYNLPLYKIFYQLKGKKTIIIYTNLPGKNYI